MIVDVCVVTKTKEMDDTCGLASVLHESIFSSAIASNCTDNFEKVVCVAAAKVPVVKIWDSEMYLSLPEPQSQPYSCDTNDL